MKAISINETISFKTKDSLIKTFLYIMISEKEFKLSDNDLNVLSLFAENNDKEEVIKESLIKKFSRSQQACENIVTRLVNLGVLIKTGMKKRVIHSDYLPGIDADIIAFKLTLYNNG